MAPRGGWLLSQLSIHRSSDELDLALTAIANNISNLGYQIKISGE